MKHRLITLITIITLTTLRTPLCAASLGEWTHYYAYNDLTSVVPTGKAVYAVSAKALFSYNPGDETVTAYNTTNLLSTNEYITDICLNRQTGRLVIAYNDGNIDLLDTRDNSVVNLAAIANEITTRSKNIQGIHCNSQFAYIVMPYGVITLNTARQEFGDTYRFNTGDATFTGAWVENDSLFLEAGQPLPAYGSAVIAGRLTDNLLDKSKWSGTAPSRAEEVKASIASDKLSRTTSRDGNRVKDTFHNCYWGTDSEGSLMKYSLSDDGTYSPQWQKGVRPDGPASNDFYNMRWLYGKLYAASSGWRTDIQRIGDGEIQIYNPQDNSWLMYEKPTQEQIGIKYQSVSDITVDPRDHNHVMVGAMSGVYEFYNGKFVKLWNKDNSTLKCLGDGDNRNYLLVLSAIYDTSGNLWAVNSASSVGIHRLSQTISNGIVTDSKWQGFPHKDIASIQDPTKMISNAHWDSKGRLWFINQNWQETDFFCYDPANDALNTYRPYYNQDGAGLYNQDDSFLRDINIDAEGNVWLCGTKGVCYLPAKDVGTNTNIMTQHKMSRNDGTGLADYLLSNVDATCIIFDSAGRKFISTKGAGIYLISADNDTEIENYTTANSGIMSNYIRYLALDESTGTLYCSTDRGLCSVHTDAVTVPATLSKDNIRVYPNPVQPGYTGMITFEGLTVGADVKITTATGTIVHSGRTTSAIYQWDGLDTFGNNCASGVYNVLLTSANGEEGCVAKVAIIR